MNERFEPEVLVLYCGHSVSDGRGVSETVRRGDGFSTKAIMVPCSSKIEVAYMLKLIEQGNDGVVLVGCPERECRFLVGSARAENRVKAARSLLEEAGIGQERLAMVRRGCLTGEDIMALAEERAGAVRELGRNPMRMSVGQSLA
jgi:coenzyme F420-reducing hydrogenase delta subunit